ncbi:MAG: amidase domain-containing protein [Limnochordaceae bacterium]|nr:amidase domain-containing protein [Limnochordaceae bacterium]
MTCSPPGGPSSSPGGDSPTWSKATDRHPKGAVNELEPGDLIGYQEKGRLVHFAPVVGRDFRGYIVVNSHTADRNAVPWDVGWDQATIFWLLKVRS